MGGQDIASPFVIKKEGEGSVSPVNEEFEGIIEQNDSEELKKEDEQWE